LIAGNRGRLSDLSDGEARLCRLRRLDMRHETPHGGRPGHGGLSLVVQAVSGRDGQPDVVPGGQFRGVGLPVELVAVRGDGSVGRSRAIPFLSNASPLS
jgi:hypothetical protein